jgi:MFS superfamily sulfate permease-like transporter
MQSVHSLFLRRRPIWKKPAPPPGVAASTWLPASQASPRILCLRLECQLSAGNADALVGAVGARVRVDVPPPCSVVLDLSATHALDDCAATALDLLADQLQRSCTTLRLVLPGAKARAAFSGDSAKTATGSDTVYTSARAALLAAYAALPGAALVTPALRELLDQPPECLPVPEEAPPQ